MTIQVLTVLLLNSEAFRTRRHEFAEEGGPEGYAEVCRAAIEIGEKPAMWIGERGFSWECPGCGHVYSGRIGDEQRGGWENPQWVLTGTPEAPSLNPSLGCSRWHAGGECSNGHWWLRDGKLVAANG